MNAFIVELYDHVGGGTPEKPLRIAGHVIKPQPNKWGCGPWSLRYCLLKWGVDIDPYEVARHAMATRRGTTNRHLELAAMRLNVGAHYVIVPTIAGAKRHIDEALARGEALIFNVNGADGGGHWIACLARDRRGYMILDPSPYEPVVQLHGWQWLKDELKRSNDRDPPLADGAFRSDIISISGPVHQHR